MEREEQMNLPFKAFSSYPPLEYNHPSSSEKYSASFMDHGRVPH
jgi:hypothetical protein